MSVSRRKKSIRQEQRVADRLEGRTTPGSGSGWATKNDVKTSDLSLEIKYTDKKSYSLKRVDLERAERQALMDSGREFAFVVGFGSVLNGTSMKIDREYVVVSREYFEYLRGQSGHPE